MTLPRDRRPKGLHRREVLRALIVERGDQCGICGKPLGNLRLCNVDHIRPIAKGGTSAWGNLQPAHVACNTAKADT